MLKKITAICLTFILVISMAIVPVFASVNQNSITTQNQTNILRYDKKDKNDNDLEKSLKKFFDSDELDWAEKAIEKMGAMGIINGMGNGLFKPKNNVTHAEAIAMVLNFEGFKTQAEAIRTQPEYFKGMSSAWSYGYLQLALDKGIIIPEEDGKFNPNTPAKRHEIAKYIVRAMGKRSLALQNMDANLKSIFKDASSIPKTSIGYVYVVSNLGIMKGSNNEFQPNKPVTRAEMAVMLSNVENNTDTPIGNNSKLEGSVVSYDSTNYKLTLNANRENIVYNVIPNVLVYKNSTYSSINDLIPGDIVKVILDSQNKVIFIEFKQAASTIPTVPTSVRLSSQTIAYESITQQPLKDRIDALKLTQGYAALKYDQNIYLIAARGQMPTGGYGIDIKDVYKETVASNKYNLKVVVESTNPTPNASVIMAITYPYEIVKLDYFSGIDKVNFVDMSNALVAQTTVNVINTEEIATGKIYYLDTTNRTIYLYENNNLRSYVIPTTAQITLGGQAATFSALVRNMPVVITKTNNVITSVAAQFETPTTATISGTIDTINATSREIRILGSNGRYTTLTIPAGVQITLQNQPVAISALLKDMPIVITLTNNNITGVAASNVVVTISGIISSVNTTTGVVGVKASNNVVTDYSVLNVPITLNGAASNLSALVNDMPIVITRTNGIITGVAATNAVVTINGIIESVNVTTGVITVKASNNVVTDYSVLNVPVTLNGAASNLSALAKYMPVTLTRTNGHISSVAATNTVVNKTGKIFAVNVADRVVRLQESETSIVAYPIPAEAAITLDTQAVTTLSALAKGMSAVITISDGIVTKLAAQNNTQSITGVLVTRTVDQNKTVICVLVGSTYNFYDITANTLVNYNGITTIQNIPLNATITIKIVNGLVTEVKN